MAEREAYARTWIEREGVEVSVGLEIRPGDSFAKVYLMTERIRDFAGTALDLGFGASHLGLTDYIEHLIRKEYPERAFFIESEAKGRGVQVYQPWGMPRKEE